MKAYLTLAFALALLLICIGCNGTVSSVSFPAASPWNQAATSILSPTDDLVAVSTGAGLESALIPGLYLDSSVQAIVACKGTSNEPYFVTCTDRACAASTVCGTNPVIEKRYTYTLVSDLDRDVFTTGSVQIQDGSGATQMGLAINAGNAGGSFDVAAGFSQGMVRGFQFDPSDAGSLVLSPHWADFGFGGIFGQVCPTANGVCQTGPIAQCDTDGDLDVLGYLTVTQPGTYSGTCGTVPVNLTINPTYASVGDCISQQRRTCNSLTGQDRKTCNHAQIGVCQATFNVSN